MVKNASNRKTDNTLTLKTFKVIKLSCLTQNNFLKKKNQDMEIVFFELLDLRSKIATLPKRVVF
jgi:hypothetical protein